MSGLFQSLQTLKGRPKAFGEAALALAFFLLCQALPADVFGTEPAPASSFGFEQVVEKARELASKPFVNPEGQVPDFLLKINYEQWRDIRFKPESSLWRGKDLLFEVQFFHPGFYYNRTVVLNVVEAGAARRIPFSPDLFDYGMNSFKDKVPTDLGFSGFRLHYPVNRKDYRDEVAVFLGVSYFRAVAKSQLYGVSARALAIDTALDSGEELPFFKEFWLVKPGPKADVMSIYALLDSASLSGAYRFLIRPGEETLIDATGTVFLRKPVKKLGLAPMTSMFFYGENTNQRPADDFRPEVHDSDGLMMACGSGEWLWRPLMNPQALSVSSFASNDPVGFGLLQCDRNFDHYQDLDLHFELRPSVWIKPQGNWGEGCVELIEIPSPAEKHDNVISFWSPKNLPPPQTPFTYAYQMRWYFPKDHLHPGGYVTATRTNHDKEKEARRFIVDFKGGRLDKLPETAAVEPVITIVGDWADLIEKTVRRNPATGGWRLTFLVASQKKGPLERVFPDKKVPLELRAFLKHGDDVLTETWSYAVQP